MSYLKKHIISGPPGSGKTTLINALASIGIPVIQEVSRRIITQEQQLNSDGMPWANIERFSNLVYNETLNQLNNQASALFCDRSLVDNIAYLKQANKPIPIDLEYFPFENFYHKTVFFAPLWQEIYTTDPQRPESFDQHIALSKELINSYQEKGFQLIYLPYKSAVDRVNFVLKNLKASV